MPSDDNILAPLNLLVDPPEKEYAAMILAQLGQICRFHVQKSSGGAVAFGVHAMARCAGSLKLVFACVNDVLFLRATVGWAYAKESHHQQTSHGQVMNTSFTLIAIFLHVLHHLPILVHCSRPLQRA
jgi:hypothetical protein